MIAKNKKIIEDVKVENKKITENNSYNKSIDGSSPEAPIVPSPFDYETDKSQEN